MKIIEKEVLKITFKQKEIINHTPNKPFAYALDWDLKYKSSHGNFKVKEKIKNSIPLENYQITLNKKDNAKIRFFNDRVSLDVQLSVKDGILFLNFNSQNQNSWRFCLPSNGAKGVFGGGEQYRKLNLKGERVVNFVSEHITVKPIIQKTILSFIKYKEKEHKHIQTYAPMSTFVFDKLYALRFDTNGYGVFDFLKDDFFDYCFYELPKKMAFVCQNSFQEIAGKLSKDTPNRQYLPDWCHDGMILGVQGGIEKVKQKAFNMIEKGAKICAVWCQDWSGKKITAVGSQVYWNWQADEMTYPNLKENIKQLKAKGVRFLAYINPYLIVGGKMYNHCKKNNLLIKNKKGNIYHIKSTTFSAGMMDLTNPQMVSFLKNTIIKENMLDLGIDGYMADFGEYLPVDCVLHKGDAKKLHNVWPKLWAKINREALQEADRLDAFFFTRSGYNGVEEYTPIMWNGDQHTDFSKDYGLPCVIPATFNLGFSGVNVSHSDIGGFISFKSLFRDEELFIRWMEMNTFSPLMRTHETIRPHANAQFDSPNVVKFTVELSSLHAKLKPYIKKCLQDANNNKMIIKPDFYLSNDFNTHKDLYSYFFGDDIYVCPIIEKGATKREVNLPQGQWVRFFTGEKYSSGQYQLEAPLGKPLAFYRADCYIKDLLRLNS